MHRFELRIHDAGAGFCAPLTLEAPDLPIALVVADINMGGMNGGTAEIWQHNRCLARIRKRCGPAQAFWELY